MVLPVTLVHHDLEAPIDFVARLAAANGFSSLRDFLAHSEIGTRGIIAGDGDALAVVAEWSGVPAARLARWAVAGNGPGGTWRMGYAILSKDMRPGRTMRFCAKCVLDDREREPGRLVTRAYRRAWWNVRGIESCRVHSCTMTEVAVDQGIDIHDFPRFVHTNLAMIEVAASTDKPGKQPDLDRFLVDQVMGIEQDCFLDSLDAHVVAEFSRYLGDLLEMHGMKEREDGDADLRELGFRLAVQGENEIRRVLAAVIDCKRPKAGFVEPCLGPMVKWFRRNLDKPAYQSLINLIQDIVEHNMPFGVGQVVLTPVTERHVYCVNSAHADFGMSKERIRALMKMNDPNFRDGLSDASTYFDAATLRPILREAAETLTSKEAGSLLGIAEDKLNGLVKHGVLAQVETKAGDERPYTRIRKEAVDDLIRRLSDKMTPVCESEGMMSLSDAARAMRRQFRQLVVMILDGRVEAFIVPGGEPVFHRARLKSGALNIDVSPMAGGDEDLMRIKEAELALGTTTGTINDLIARGYLLVQNVRRETGHSVKFIERQSLAEFDADHISLSAIAKLRQGYRAYIKLELEALGIEPIFEPQGFNARFYLKSDLVRAEFQV
jgi:hypothetical protein